MSINRSLCSWAEGWLLRYKELKVQCHFRRTKGGLNPLLLTSVWEKNTQTNTHRHIPFKRLSFKTSLYKQIRFFTMFWHPPASVRLVSSSSLPASPIPFEPQHHGERHMSAPKLGDTVDGSHDLQGFIHPRWCKISAINSISSLVGPSRKSNKMFKSPKSHIFIGLRLNQSMPYLSTPDIQLVKSSAPWKSNLPHKPMLPPTRSTILHCHLEHAWRPHGLKMKMMKWSIARLKFHMEAVRETYSVSGSYSRLQYNSKAGK